MARIGLNVSWNGSHSAQWLRGSGSTLARLCARRDIDLTETLRAYKTLGIRPILVLDRTSIEEFPSPEAACAEFAARYSGLDCIIQPGNEPDADPSSASSWVMPQADMAQLGRTARAAWPRATVITPGLVSGDPGWLQGVDLDWADAIAVHPYGKRPLPEWPDPSWGTGYLKDLLDGYANFNRPLFVTEMGLSSSEVSEDLQAAYVRHCLDELNKDNRVLGVTWFCADDETMVPEYGLWRSLADPKPAASDFQIVANYQDAILIPTPGGPIPLPHEPSPTDPAVGLSADDASLLDLWRSIDPTLVLNPDAAIARLWRSDPYLFGPPVGPERYDRGEDGSVTAVYQAFGHARLRWRAGESDAEVVE